MVWSIHAVNFEYHSLVHRSRRLSMVCIILYIISQFSDMVEGHTGRGRIWTVMRGDGRRLLPFRFEESQLRWRWNVHRQSQQLPRQPESLLHRSRKLSSRSSFSSLIFLFSFSHSFAFCEQVKETANSSEWDFKDSATMQLSDASSDCRVRRFNKGKNTYTLKKRFVTRDG